MYQLFDDGDDYDWTNKLIVFISSNPTPPISKLILKKIQNIVGSNVFSSYLHLYICTR